MIEDTRKNKPDLRVTFSQVEPTDSLMDYWFNWGVWDNLGWSESGAAPTMEEVFRAANESMERYRALFESSFLPIDQGEPALAPTKVEPPKDEPQKPDEPTFTFDSEGNAI